MKYKYWRQHRLRGLTWVDDEDDDDDDDADMLITAVLVPAVVSILDW
jgi:hypothetical protein